MGKDRGKGKRSGGTRGEKIFIENEEEMAIQDAVQQIEHQERVKRRGDDTEPAKGGKAKGKIESEGKVAKGDDGDDNSEDNDGKEQPELPPKAAKVTEEVPLTRREREAQEAAAKKAEYERRHLAGETEQARKDLERLALVRQKREADRLKREAEGRAPGWVQPPSDDDSDGSDDSEDEKPVAKAPPVMSEAAAKKRAAAVAEEPPTDTKAELPRLKTIDIKKMNGDAVKEHLKARNLNIQGPKKDLMQRLIDFEQAREASGV